MPKTATKKRTQTRRRKPSERSTKKRGQPKKEGLRKPQIRILETLARNKRPLTRKEISEKAPCDLAGLTEWLGSLDDAIRERNDRKHFPSLISLDYVKVNFAPKDKTDGARASYEIAAEGRKAIGK